MISATSKLKKIENLFVASIDDEIVIFDPENGNYFGAGEVGARIWELLDEHTLVSSLCLALEAEYEVASAEYTNETLSFLSDLEANGLVEQLELEASVPGNVPSSTEDQ